MATLIRAANPIWWLPDLTGVSLNDEYYAFFLTNTFPYVPQAVYQGPATTDPVWPSPLEFSPAGTLPDNLYFDPSLVYRIEVRHGNTQADALIWEINNFVPGENGAGPAVENELTVAANLITNPQFADIDFQSPFTFTTSTPATYTFDIGPGWQIIVTGTGTLTLTQHTNAGTSHITGNPPYYLDIFTSNWTTAILRQKLANNGAIFSGGAIAIALTAAAVTSAKVLTVQYAPSTGTATNIFQQNIPTGTLTPYTGYANTADAFHPLPLSTNSDVGTAAYVNIDFLLPGTGELELTNIQIVGQSDPLSAGFDTTTDLPAFRELTYEQVENGEFNVYRDDLLYKQVPSYLVGWDFPLNPAQFLGDTVPPLAIGANKSYYAWDQTIIFQSVDSGVSVARGSGGNIGLQAAQAGQMAIIQYIELSQARKLLCQDICANICALASPNNVKYTISLWYTTDASLPNIKSGTNNSLIATLDATTGKPASFNGNWTEVPNAFSQPAFNTIEGPKADLTEWNDYPHVGWALKNNTTANTVTFMAIVIGTLPMAQNDVLDINSISLQAGNIPTRPAPQTPDEVLRECEFFYEKTYGSGVLLGTITLRDAIFSEQYIHDVSGGPDTVSLKSRGYMINYSLKLISTPIITFYSPATGTSDKVRGYTTNAGTAVTDADITQSSNWGLVSVGEKSQVYLPSNVNDLVGPTATIGNSFPEAYILFHYTVDARMGTY